MVKEINTEEFNSLALQGTSVVDFSASWCGPCQMLAPVLEEISNDFAAENRNIKFYKVDIDKCPELAQQFGIRSVPSVFIFKNGQLAGQTMGFKPKPVLANEILTYC